MQFSELDLFENIKGRVEDEDEDEDDEPDIEINGSKCRFFDSHSTERLSKIGIVLTKSPN